MEKLSSQDTELRVSLWLASQGVCIIWEIEDLPGLKIGDQNIKNFRYADDTPL